MSITKKGFFWEIWNSLWILLSFWWIPWAGFLYIGKRARNRKWTMYAVIYAVLELLMFILCGFNYMPTLGAVGLIVLYVSGIVYSFLVRKEYLIAREYIITSGIEELENERLRESIRNSFENNNKEVETVEIKEEPETVDYSEYLYSENKKININISTKEELLALPGVNSEIAEKAINFRTKFGGFASTREFVEILQIDSRYLSEIQKKATVK